MRRRSETSSGSWMGKVTINVRNSVRQEDAHYAQISRIYKTVIRHVLMYGSETWAVRKAEQNLLERTELIMLIWMLGIKRIEKSRNEEIRARAGAANISEKIK